MKGRTKLNSEQDQRQTVAENQTGQTAAQEFGTVEELLRHDAAQTTVPPVIEQRLEQSASRLPPPRPWWRRVFDR